MRFAIKLALTATLIAVTGYGTELIFRDDALVEGLVVVTIFFTIAGIFIAFHHNTRGVRYRRKTWWNPPPKPPITVQVSAPILERMGYRDGALVSLPVALEAVLRTSLENSDGVVVRSVFIEHDLRRMAERAHQRRLDTEMLGDVFKEIFGEA